jgi:hypothetical protein
MSHDSFEASSDKCQINLNIFQYLLERKYLHEIYEKILFDVLKKQGQRCGKTVFLNNNGVKRVNV